MTATLARTLYNCTLHHTLLHEAHFLNWPLTLSKLRMQRLMARAKPSQHPKSCSALCCCGSRFSSSSLSSSSSSSCPAEQSADSLSYLTHAIVQSRLQRMINESSTAAAAAAARRRRSSKLVVLLAVDRNSYDPRTDFRESILEVIVSKGMQEPKELRSLLNCYISLNSREQRQVILEAFHEVCSTLFVGNSKSSYGTEVL